MNLNSEDKLVSFYVKVLFPSTPVAVLPCCTSPGIQGYAEMFGWAHCHDAAR